MMDRTGTELLRPLFENGMIHTAELAAALGLAVDEACSRMERLQRLGVVEHIQLGEAS